MANYLYISETGVIIPDTSTTRTDVENEFKAAFGLDLNLDPATPQGVLITAETLARDSVVRNNSELANQINPNEAGGVFLKGVCALLGFEPTLATRSIVYGVELSGNVGVTINAGSRIKSSTNTVFEAVSNITIGIGGIATGTFQCVIDGAVEAPANTLTTIVDGVIGWGSVTNPDAAIVGQNEMSDTDARKHRRLNIAKNGKSTVLASVSNLDSTIGVSSFRVRENVESTTQTINGVVLPANSFWSCVDGGADADVATALVNSKSSGSKWTSGTSNGTPVSVTLIHPASGQSYTVKFSRPNLIPMLARVTVTSGASIAEVTGAVQDAIVAYANGQQAGEDGLMVGVSVSPFELAGAVSRTNPEIFVKNVEITKTSVNVFQSSEIAMTLWEKATITAASISVVKV